MSFLLVYISFGIEFVSKARDVSGDGTTTSVCACAFSKCRTTFLFVTGKAGVQRAIVKGLGDFPACEKATKDMKFTRMRTFFVRTLDVIHPACLTGPCKRHDHLHTLCRHCFAEKSIHHRTSRRRPRQGHPCIPVQPHVVRIRTCSTRRCMHHTYPFLQSLMPTFVAHTIPSTHLSISQHPSYLSAPPIPHPYSYSSPQPSIPNTTENHQYPQLPS